MMTYDQCFDFLLALEGWDSLVTDTGGLTKYGISEKAYPDLDIANLTQDQAKEIYRRDYWIPAGCEGMGSPKNLCVFQLAVNQGVSQAREISANSLDCSEVLLWQLLRYSRLARQDTYRRYLAGWVYRICRTWEAVS